MQKKNFLDGKTHALFFFGIPPAALAGLFDYTQLNESIPDALAVVKGGANSSSFYDFFNTYYSPNTFPSNEIIELIRKLNEAYTKSLPMLTKMIYLIISTHPNEDTRINLVKHLENKYPNGIETINEQTIKQLRTDILRYNKVSLCAEYALYAAAGYLTYKTVRMFAEDELLPYSSKINTFFEKVDQKVDDCKVFVKNKVSQSLEYFTSKRSENS